MTDAEAKAARWLTDEEPPRELVVEGTAAIDPDVFVARVKDGDGALLWIVKSSGYVCGLSSAIT